MKQLAGAYGAVSQAIGLLERWSWLNLFVYCCGGFGREVADIAHRVNKTHHLWERIAFLDDAADEGSLQTFEVYRLDSAIRKFGVDAMEAVIASGEPFVRHALLDKLTASRICLTKLIDNTAVVSESAIIGDGAIVFPGCYISNMARLGCNSAMVTGSMVGHDVVMGDNCVLSGHVNIGGGCVIGNNSYIGMGAQVKQLTRIGHGTIVGMGSIVLADLSDEVIAMGNPCRTLRPNTRKRIFK